MESLTDLDAVAGPRAEGRTALHVASEHGHAANVTVLVDAGANLMIRDHLGLTPLDLADKAEHTECMAVLRAAADKQVELTNSNHGASLVRHWGLRLVSHRSRDRLQSLVKLFVISVLRNERDVH